MSVPSSLSVREHHEDTLILAEIRKQCLFQRGGLGTSAARKKYWPLILGLDRSTNCTSSGEQQQQQQQQQGKPINPDAEQIAKDIDRSMWAFTRGMTDAERQVKREQLSRILNGIFDDNERSIRNKNTAQDTTTTTTTATPSDSANENNGNIDINHAWNSKRLYYFQGFHEFAGVVLLVANGDESLASECIRQLAQFHFRDHLESEVMMPCRLMMKMIHPLLALKDEQLAKLLQQANLEDGYFAVSWILTWFADAIEDLDTVARLYDFFMVSHPLMSVYFTVALIIANREALLNSKRRDYATLSSLLKQTFTSPESQHALDYEALIRSALALYVEFPPTTDFLTAKLNLAFPPSSWLLKHPYDYVPTSLFEQESAAIEAQVRASGSASYVSSIMKYVLRPQVIGATVVGVASLLITARLLYKHAY